MTIHTCILYTYHINELFAHLSALNNNTIKNNIKRPLRAMQLPAWTGTPPRPVAPTSPLRPRGRAAHAAFTAHGPRVAGLAGLVAGGAARLPREVKKKASGKLWKNVSYLGRASHPSISPQRLSDSSAIFCENRAPKSVASDLVSGSAAARWARRSSTWPVWRSAFARCRACVREICGKSWKA